LYVQLDGPPGAHVTLYNGMSGGREFPIPVVVGLRPGYIYQVKLTNLPGFPAAALYPTIEVRGTLQLPAGLRPSSYPAPIVINARDIAQATTGAFLNKVVYMEPAEQARPNPAALQGPLELEVRPGQDALEEARSLGRPLALVRLGGRDVSETELIQHAIPGTVLLPGDRALGPPACAPAIPAASYSLIDPRLGPVPPGAECLHDGGDVGLPAGLDASGQLHGVDPSDTVAVYSDSRGDRHVAVSNRICICVPRFAVLRSEIVPAGYAIMASPGIAGQAIGRAVMQAQQPSLVARNAFLVAGVQTRERPSAAEATTGLLQTERFEGLAMIRGRMKNHSIVGVAVKPTPAAPDRPLILQKTADKAAAQIGEIVTFTLRYTNRGGQPISDVLVTDSLTGRLDYVPGSQQTDRSAIFTMQANEAESQLLRWEIAGRLLPGETGTIVFQARVR
jgi:uncharacterized repeat protein (TIGR01451 family)